MQNTRKHKITTRILTLIMAIMILFQPTMKAQAALTAERAIAKGIDVSKYQELIDWIAVKSDGYSFAFIRCGTSTTPDPYFDLNMIGAAQAGIKAGVYLYSYALTPEEAAADAYNVLAMIGPHIVSMPVVIDLETEKQKQLTPEQLAAVANTFCAVVESAGYYPMVYSSTSAISDRSDMTSGWHIILPPAVVMTHPSGRPAAPAVLKGSRAMWISTCFIRIFRN